MNNHFCEDGEHWVDSVTPHGSRQLCPEHKAKAEERADINEVLGRQYEQEQRDTHRSLLREMS